MQNKNPPCPQTGSLGVDIGFIDPLNYMAEHDGAVVKPGSLKTKILEEWYNLFLRDVV